MEREHRGVLKTTLLVTLIILISKTFGFLREMVFAAKFGASIQSDAYIMAFGILNVFILLLNSASSSTFIPIYTQTQLRENKKSANDYVNNILNFFIILSIILSVLAVWQAGGIIKLVAQGFSGEQLDLTVKLSQLMFPSLVFFCISNVLCSFLNAREKYIAPQLIGLALSACVITAAVFFSKTYGVDAIAYATVIASVLQVLMLVPFAWGDFSYKPQLRLRDGKLKRTIYLAIPAILGMTINEINHLVDIYFASSLPAGSISALSFAFKLVSFLMGIVIVPVSTVLFSKLSQFAAKNDHKSIVSATKQSIEVLALILLPIVGIGIVMNTEIIKLIYQRGSFSTSATAMTSYAFVFYLVGVLSFGLVEILTRVYYAKQDTKKPMLFAAIAVAINTVLDFLIVQGMGVGGLALATALASTSNAVMLLIMLRRKLGKLGLKSTLGQFILIILASAAAVAVTIVIRDALPFTHTLLRLVICTGAGLIVYIGLALMLRIREVKCLARDILRKVKHRS